MVKILVVDDEIEICDFVKNFFKEREFEVFTAYNGEEALSIIEMQAPQIILLDVKMPVMDGIQTLKELGKREVSGKIIMVTAVEEQDIMDEANQYGATRYITKPLSLLQLEEAVFDLAGQVSA